MCAVCLSHELVLHLNICSEKPVISCKVQYSFSEETESIVTVSATCYLQYEECL